MNHRKKDQIDLCKQLLNLKPKKKRIKHWQPKLTLDEKFLFDNEKFLSAYQTIIANTCGQHRHQQQNHSSIEQTLLPIHIFCRKGVYPGTSISRQQINDDQVPWTVNLPDYNPPYYTHSSLLVNTNDTDPEKLLSNFMWNTFDTKYNVDRRTASPVGSYRIDNKGYPLNPLGRTGLRGRGLLNRWAVNYLTHLVIMCGTNEIKSGKEVFKYIMKTSDDNYYDHLPSTSTTGTNMNAISKTLATFLNNIYQTWNNFDNIHDEKINEIIDHLTFVSTAYIDDSKNTDNAWLETSICCYVQTNINKNISSNQHIDLNQLFPDPSSNEKLTYTWRYVSHTTKLLDSEHNVIKLIAKRYNAYW
ncbi:unnamed protein product [Adineta steineri]|uniref:Uncharacterized protein n=1 Tax=Adineta steineri TaxID=433720 RepID=A0A814XHA6_9BILA|nr:unnamed protein product [Adineta steineri]CAF1501437.1 unnamed protein product [Adineta steineri]